MDRSIKPLIAELSNAYEVDLIDHTSEEGSLVFTSHYIFGIAELRTKADQAGFLVHAMTRTMPSGHAFSEGDPNYLFPVKQDSGNADAANEQYDAAKATWISSNPDLYEAILNGERTPYGKDVPK